MTTVTKLSEALQVALQYHRANRLVEAEQVYRKILAGIPKQPDALYGLGMLAQQVGQYQNAEEFFNTTLLVDPESFKAWFSLGNLHQAQGQLSEAVEAYQRALALQPNSVALYNNFGYALQQQGKWENAIACYQKALELQPNCAEADVNLGNALYAQGQLSQDKHAYYAALNHDLGVTRKIGGDLKTAVAYYRNAIALQPDLVDAHSHLGVALQEQGKLEEAIACSEQAIKLNPNYGEAYMHLGRIYQMQNKFEKAATAYRQGLSLIAPGDATVVEAYEGSQTAEEDYKTTQLSLEEVMVEEHKFPAVPPVLASEEELYLKPILVTGSHRSGSTWTGKMLALSSIVHYIHEPFNFDFYPDAPFKHMFQYITVEDGKLYEDYIRRILYPSQVDSSTIRPLMKDPIALLSAEWLHTTFDMQVIVMIRHPAAFTASCKRMNWGFGFEHLVGQPRLLDGLLRDFKDDIIQFANEKYDLIDQCILSWRFLHAIILKYRECHPNWLFVRHEDLSRSFLTAFGELFEYVKLPYTPKQQKLIHLYCNENNSTEAKGGNIHQLKRNSTANIWSWKKQLTEDEQMRIRRGTIDIAQYFYGPEDW
ncbi:tetratricopeptide repeat protein [Moorena producens JHB]|uniref:Tetratricopeptide repeat protein n=1 Tax=Moorena producens (strain JHB) TaxID=1454205 RepID=A0A1D9FVP8_MOOP1|nr:tetratricopeptide repeat protein [Moorena producens]AOY79411.2 tetratricopeptide repeat protein [Moorena producens JHB]